MDARKTAAAQHAHAMPFDGTRYATLPQSTKFTSGDFTISLWFDPASAADRILFMRGFAYRDQQGDIGLKVNLANGDLDFEARTADSRWIFGWEAPQSLLHSPFKLKEWNHVVVTRNGESYAMWMNGVKVRTARSPADISDTNDSNPFIIGGMMTERGVEGRFHGALDDFRIFHRCLSDAEITALHGTGAGVGLEDESVKINVAELLKYDQPAGVPQWSERPLSKTPDGREFAGPFHNQTVTLTLDDLPKHAWVKVHARPPGQTSGTSYLSASCTTA